jgi:hypothetical protein
MGGVQQETPSPRRSRVVERCGLLSILGVPPKQVTEEVGPAGVLGTRERVPTAEEMWTCEPILVSPIGLHGSSVLLNVAGASPGRI